MALEPDYWGNYHFLGGVHMMDYYLGSTKNPVRSLESAIECLEKAVALTNDAKGSVYPMLGNLYAMKKHYNQAIKLGEEAIAIVPNGADAHAWLAMSLTFAGRANDAIPLFEKAMRLNPLPPAFYYLNFGNTYRLLGRFEEAVAMYKKTIALTPNNIFAYIGLAGAYGLMGMEEEATKAGAEILRINPKWSIEYHLKTSVFNDRERLAEVFRKVGLPEKPPLPIPDKPSIAVLPFVNMSDDKSQEFFSDGLTEEIITALSKTPKLFVIARNSTYVYKGKPVNVQQVSRELGVKYVLEGSVRRSGDQLRITAQLIDATTGNHLWAERYDREVKDIFAIQDEVTMKILTSILGTTLMEESMAEHIGKGASNVGAYVKSLEGRALFFKYTKDDNALARKKFEEAIGLDPQWAPPYAGLGWTYFIDSIGSRNPQEALSKAYECAQKATSLDATNLSTLNLLRIVYQAQRRYEESITTAEKAIKVAPGSADAYAMLGETLLLNGSYKEALVYFEKALRMNPFPETWYLMDVGAAHFILRNYEEAISTYKKALSISPTNSFARSGLIATYVEMGRMEEAKAEAEELIKINPKWTSKGLEKGVAGKDPKVRERYMEAFRKVGLERDVSTN